MGICYYLVDYDNKHLVDMDKVFPLISDDDFDDDVDALKYYVHWFGNVVRALYKRKGLFQIINDCDVEYDSLRFDKGFDVGYYDEFGNWIQTSVSFRN